MKRPVVEEENGNMPFVPSEVWRCILEQITWRYLVPLSCVSAEWLLLVNESVREIRCVDGRYIGRESILTKESLLRFPNLRSLTIIKAETLELPDYLYTNLTTLHWDTTGICSGRPLNLLVNLRSLLLTGNGYLADGLRGMTQLTALYLGWHVVLSDIEIASLTQLRRLTLSKNPIISDRDLRVFTQLTALKLSCATHITNEGISELHQLTALSLVFNWSVTDTGLRSLTNLKSLSLRKTSSVLDGGIRFLTRLTFLNLSDNAHITDCGFSELVNLRTFRFAGNYFGDPLVALAGLQSLANLTYLTLRLPEFCGDVVRLTKKLTFLDATGTHNLKEPAEFIEINK